MKSQSTRRGRVTALAAAASLIAVLPSSPTLGQGLPNPSRQGATGGDTSGLAATYNNLRASEARVEFLTDVSRQAEDWYSASKFASCAANLNRDRVRELLDQAIDGKAKKRVQLDDFVGRNQGCVLSAGKLDSDFIRGALAESVVTTGEERLPPPGTAENVTAFIKTVTVPRMEKDDPFVAGQLVAECRVGFAPGAARALLATEAGSPGEAGALAAMKAVTPQCNSLDTAKLKLTPHFERAFAAQALYHWIGFAAEKG